MGSVIIVQNTGGIMVQKPNPGARQALGDFLTWHPGFKSDRSREGMLLNMHPKGYLKRIF